MGRKGVKKKKEIPILFPSVQGSVSSFELHIGTTLRIGRPSNRYYQYLFVSLDFLNQKLDDLSKLIGLEGTLVRVIGEISLSDGNNFVIVQKEDGTSFFDGGDRLFVEGQKALDCHELISEY